MVDITAPVLQGILFAFFSAFTAILAALLGPTYTGLLVPELDPSSLYPALGPPGSGFLGAAAGFSGYLVDRIVDPAVPLFAVGIGVLYLARASVPSLAAKAQSLLPKFVFAVVLSNFTLPVAGAILGLAGAGYPVIAGFDGGAWRSWVNLAGVGEISFSWDNGLLAFLLTLVLFVLVLLLAVAVALRDALLAVLVVLLPLLTLLYPIPALAPLARKGWLLFGELAFLPWVVVIPLELAVGSPSILLLVGYLSVALAAPGLLSFAGGQLLAVGFPSAGPAVAGELRRGQTVGSAGLGTLASPVLRAGEAPASPGSALRSATRTAAGSPMPLSFPFFAGELAGQGLLRGARHLPGGDRLFPAARSPPRFPPAQGPARRGR